MIARAVNAAADVIHRAQTNGAVTAAGIAVALESAQLLASPELVHESAKVEAERDALKVRVAELELELKALKAQGELLKAARPWVSREEQYKSPLHHDYQVSHDLPARELGGA